MKILYSKKNLLMLLALVLLPTIIAVKNFRSKALEPQHDIQAGTQTVLEEPAPPTEAGPIDGEKVSMEMAQGRLPWAIPLPNYTIDNSGVAEVWTSSEGKSDSEKQLYVIYGNGLEISIWPEAGSPNFSKWEPPFRALVVKGISAAGTDPGVQQVEEYGENKYPGSVSWWENGLVINLYGDFPLEELLKVAESMPDVAWRQ